MLTETFTDVSNDRSAIIFKVKNAPVFLHCLTLKMKETRYFETSATIHQSTRGNTPEDLNLQQYPCKNSSLANPFFFYVLSHQQSLSRASCSKYLSEQFRYQTHVLSCNPTSLPGDNGPCHDLLTNVRNNSSID